MNPPGPIRTRVPTGRPKAWHQHSAFAWPILAFRHLAGLDFIIAALASSRMLSSRHPASPFDYSKGLSHRVSGTSLAGGGRPSKLTPLPPP
jgi:hypothetical protein